LKAIKNIAAIFLVPLIIWAGMGFSVNKHYCLGMLKAESFYVPAEKCYMAPAESTCGNFEKIATPDCCQDETLSIAGINFQRIVDEVSEKVLAKTSLAIVFFQDHLPNALLKKDASWYLLAQHIPPPLNLQIQFQQFLI
jgi:hypothetical protein